MSILADINAACRDARGAGLKPTMVFIPAEMALDFKKEISDANRFATLGEYEDTIRIETIFGMRLGLTLGLRVFVQ